MKFAPLLLLLTLLVACQGPGRYAEGGVHGPFCERIDAAAAIPFSSDRSPVLVEIAGHPDLTGHEQCHLIDVTIAAGGFSGDMVTVFLALADNPFLTTESRDYLAERLPSAGLFSSDQGQVTARLVPGEKGTVAAGS